MQILPFIAFCGLVLVGCTSAHLNKNATLDYCQSNLAKTDYNMYLTDSNTPNAKIIGEKILPNNAFELVEFSESEGVHSPKNYSIHLVLKVEFARDMYRFTTKHLGKTMGIAENEQLISNSTIQMPFGHNFQIEFNDKNEAIKIFDKLKYINCQ